MFLLPPFFHPSSHPNAPPSATIAAAAETPQRDRPPEGLPRRRVLQFALALTALPLAVAAQDAANGDSPAYDAYASTYELLDGTNSVTRALGFDLLRSTLLSKARGSVLELAAGSGINLPFYPSHVNSVLALDISPAMLRIADARAKSLSYPFSVTTLVGDAAHTSLPDSSFDTIVITFGLCVVSDPPAVLAEARRLVKPDGCLLVLDYTHSSNSYVVAYQDFTSTLVSRLSKGCVPNLDLPNLCRRAKFSPISSDSQLAGTILALQAQPV